MSPVALLALELEAGVKVVEQLPIGSFDQRIHRLHHLRIIVPLIPKALPNVGPVLLLHMRIVVFLVGPTPRHEHRPPPLLQPVEHVIV